jgi:pimeloyl-ACP methyl ester carboxylesterase
MVAPMTAAFRRGDSEGGVAIFIDYVLNDPGAWARMSASSKQETMRNVREWEATFNGGELFPTLAPAAVRRIEAPALMISGEKSYGFMRLIDEILAGLLPHVERLVVPGVGHQMWMQAAETCRSRTLAFLA